VASPLPSRASREGAYRVILLADRKRPGGRAIAAAALSDAHGSLRAPNAAFLAAIADGLAEVTTASHSEHSV
jgi:hypothetical protein